MTLASNGSFGLDPKTGQIPKVETELNKNQWLELCQSLPGIYSKDFASVLQFHHELKFLKKERRISLQWAYFLPYM